MSTPNPDPLDPTTIAADYVLAALGREHAALVIGALSAGWLTAEEHATLRPLAVAVAYLAGEPYPKEHRS